MKAYTLRDINNSIDLCATLHLDDFKLLNEHTSADQDLLLFVEQNLFGKLNSYKREACADRYYRSLNL